MKANYMERKTEQALTIAKFTAYAGVLAVIVLSRGPGQSIGLALWLALIVSGSVRHFVLYGSCKEPWTPATFLIEILVAWGLARIGYGGIDIVIYFVVISESTISGKTQVGIAVTLISAAALWLGRLGIWGLTETLLYVGINGAALLFAFTVSLAVKRETSRREELVHVLSELEYSKTELEKTYNDLRESQLRLQDMAVTEERARMAREIHDTLAHSMTAIVVTLEAARRKLVKGDRAVAADIERAQEQARHGLDEVRRSVTELRPLVLSTGNLPDALRLLLSQIEKWHHIDTELTTMELPSPLTRDQEVAIYRLVQEAATNSVRHGKSGMVSVRLAVDSDKVLISVVDDGLGTVDIVPGNGLIGMRERIAECGGEVGFVSQPGAGFTVHAVFPLTGGVEDDQGIPNPHR